MRGGIRTKLETCLKRLGHQEVALNSNESTLVSAEGERVLRGEGGKGWGGANRGGGITRSSSYPPPERWQAAQGQRQTRRNNECEECQGVKNAISPYERVVLERPGARG